jgi:hypothetical protein
VGEFSSRPIESRVVFEELSRLSNRATIIRMPTMSRPEQRYDHRLRDLVQRTGDLIIATDLGVPRSTDNLANIYALTAQYERAEPIFLATIAARRRVLGESHPQTTRTWQRLGAMYVPQGRFDQAEPILLSAYASFATRLGAEHERSSETRRSIVALYDAWKRPEKAAKWRVKP